MFKFNIQLFADIDGMLVNNTTNFTNPYTGVEDSFDSTHTMSPEMKTFYDTLLLENARIDMKLAQFGSKQALPANHGRTVEWRKPNTFARAEELTEGVIPTGQKFGWSSQTASIKQFGTYAAASDILELHAYDDNIRAMTEEMGASAAETQEYLIRQALMGNTNVVYCDNISTAGAYIDTPDACSKMGASNTNGWAKLTADMVNKVATKMKKDKVPKINGRYYCVIHPSCVYDLRKDPAWIDAHKYAQPDEIYNGEIGELHGVRFIEDNFMPVLTGAAYKNKDNTASYASFFFGKEAFKTIDPEGGALQMIIKSAKEIGGPLEQFGTVGYKFETNGATVVYPERVVRVMSTSTYSATDVAN